MLHSKRTTRTTKESKTETKREHITKQQNKVVISIQMIFYQMLKFDKSTVTL